MKIVRNRHPLAPDWGPSLEIQVSANYVKMTKFSM